MKINSIYGYIEVPKIKIRNGKRYTYSTVEKDINSARTFAKMLREQRKNIGVITSCVIVKQGRLKGQEVGIIYIRKNR